MNAERSSEEGTMPEFLRPLFWDVDFDRLRIPGRERYIIERILDWGMMPMRCRKCWSPVAGVRSSGFSGRKSAG